MTEGNVQTQRRRGRPATQRPASDAGGEHRVEAVERALSILSAFIGSDRPTLSLTEIAEKTGFYPSTISRLAGSLIRFGYLYRDADGLFRLGPTPMQLGTLYRDSFRLGDYVRPVLLRLVERTGETGAFYVREGKHRICLYRHDASRTVRHHVDEGTKLTLDAGASAHVLVAFTDESERYGAVRDRGYAVSLGERDPEAAAIAAPVFGPDGRLVGALNISGPIARFRDADTSSRVEAVLDLARLLTQQLGGLPRG